MTNKETEKHKKESKTSKSWAIIAAIVSIVSIFVALQANYFAFVSLQNSYTPWLRIKDVRFSVADPNTIEIKYVCKNFASGPALNLDMNITISGKSTKEKLYDSEALMPNSEGEYSSYVNLHGLYKPEDFLEKLEQEKSFIIFDIHFEDIFGRRIKVHQECKSIKGILRTTVYKVDGLSSPAWKAFLNIFES